MTLKNRLRSILGLRSDQSFGFYAADFLFRRMLRQNSGVRWAIHHSSTIHNPAKLVCGIGTWPGDSPGVYINANNGVYIGDFTNLGPQVGLLSSNHDFIDNDHVVAAPPIRIGAFCWLGMGAKILPGVELGNFTVVGAGAVVTRSFPEGYCVIAGNPARIIRPLNKEDCDAQARAKYAAQPAR